MFIEPIGHIASPYLRLCDCPKNIRDVKAPCRLVIDPAYQRGLDTLEVGRRYIVLYWLDKACRRQLKTHQRGPAGPLRGCFAIRTPNRPNPIGLGVVTLTGIDKNILSVSGLDALNGTPVIDIKPFHEDNDCPAVITR